MAVFEGLVIAAGDSYDGREDGMQLFHQGIVEYFSEIHCY